jgi:hypothetical protein
MSAIVEIIHGVAGISGAILNLFARGVDSIANGSGDTLVEQTNRQGVYRATVEEPLTGLHEAYMVDGSGHVLYAGVIDLRESVGVQTVAELCHAITDSAGGVGARTVVVTVNDGEDPLQAASVRLTRGAESYIRSTDASGQCVFNVDDGPWVVAITLAGYTFDGATLVVDGDESTTYLMTRYAIAPPAAPNLTTGYVLCLGIDGLPEANVTISAQMTAGPGVDGYALDTETIAMISGADGIAQHTGFVRGASYKFRRGNSAWWSAAQVAPNANTWNLREILGTP